MCLLNRRHRLKGLFADDQIRARASNIAADALPKDLPVIPPNVEEEGNRGSLLTTEPRSSPQCVLDFVDRSPPELPKPPVQQPEQTAKPKLAALKSVIPKKKPRSQTTPILGTAEREPPKRQFSWPGLSVLSPQLQTNGENNQPPGFIKRARKNAMSLSGRGWNKLRMALKAISRFKKFRKRRPAAQANP